MQVLNFVCNQQELKLATRNNSMVGRVTYIADQ